MAGSTLLHMKLAATENVLPKTIMKIWESLKEYIYADAIPAHGYLTYAYKYENGNRVSNNGNLVMRIVSLKGDVMKIIDYLGIRADGVKLYGYSTYRRMNSGAVEN